MAPGCVDAAIVWVVPAVYGKVQGAVQAAPSTVSDRAVGELVTVIVTALPIEYV
jgi:hypothetical protein